MTVNDRLALVIGHAVIERVLAQDALAKAQAEAADLRARLAEHDTDDAQVGADA